MQEPRVKNKTIKTVLVATCVVVTVIIGYMVLDPGPFLRSVTVRFEWRQGSQGFNDISVEWPRLGSLHSRLIAVQAKPYISSYFEKAGWKAAQGRMNMRAFCFLFVLGLDQRDSWNVEIIDPEVTPLMHAVEDGDAKLTARLIAEGSDVNAQDQRGWTALMHVGMKGRGAEAKALLAAGADPNLKDRDGRTAFLWAAWNCRSDVATALVDAGADVDVKDRFGSTAMSSTICPELVQGIVRKPKTVH